jgi:hypothetical protein
MCFLALAASGVCSGQDAAAGVTDQTPPAKKQSFLKRMFSLQALTATVPGAVLQQVHDWPEEWGKQRAGFEKRAASLYGQFVIGAAIEEGVMTLHHEDPTYHRLGHGNFIKRTAHVITDTVTARKPDGRRTISLSMPANAYGSWAIATLWSPREYRSAGSIFEWGSAGVGTAAGSNFAREFWPDVKAVFRRKKHAQQP